MNFTEAKYADRPKEFVEPFRKIMRKLKACLFGSLSERVFAQHPHRVGRRIPIPMD
jgi:hypothetical protein